MAWHPFRNLGLKVAALGLGTLLWFTVSGQQVERTVCACRVDLPQRAGRPRDHRRHAGHRRRPRARRSTGSSSARSSRATSWRVVDLTDARPGAQHRSRCAPIRSARRSASRSCRSIPSTVTLTLETAGTAQRAGAADGRRHAGAGIRRRRRSRRARDGRGGRAGEPAAATRPTAIDRARVDRRRAATRSPQTVSVGVTDAALRLREPRPRASR